MVASKATPSCFRLRDRSFNLRRHVQSCALSLARPPRSGSGVEMGTRKWGPDERVKNRVELPHRFANNVLPDRIGLEAKDVIVS